MKQWKEIARGLGLNIPDLERIVPALDGLESAFRPLVKTIPHDAEPALTFHAAHEVPEELQ
jgi:hypothetical protein